MLVVIEYADAVTVHAGDAAVIIGIYAEITESMPCFKGLSDEFGRLIIELCDVILYFLFRRQYDLRVSYIVKEPAGFIEETIFRGGLLTTMLRKMNSPNRILTAAVISAAVFGVIHMTKSLAVELVDYNIRVNSISPGYVATPMSVDPDFVEPELLAAWEPLFPMHRMAKPEELTGAIIWLASDASHYANGTDILIDGLYTAV